MKNLINAPARINVRVEIVVKQNEDCFMHLLRNCYTYPQYKVCGCYSVTFLNRTQKFDWCVVG